MNIAVYCRRVIKRDEAFLKGFFTHLEKLRWNPIIEKDFHKQLVDRIGICNDASTFSSYMDLESGIDMAISIGGDGTFLKMVGYIRSSGIPVMGINTGRLGFLANIPTESFEEKLAFVKKKQYVFQKRSLLRIETEESIFGDQNFAFNEMTVHKKDTSSMITVHASIDGNYLNSYWADGLIASTPTGSTAYSLSCGGPIITPGCQVHILTPIAPHNLNVRPVVVPDHLPIELTVEGRDRKYLLTLDSDSKAVKNGTKITLYKADFMINVFKFEENNFLDTIRNKMMWGLDKRNEY